MLYTATYDGGIRYFDDNLEEKVISLEFKEGENDHITSIEKNRDNSLVCMGTLGGRILFFDAPDQLCNAYRLDSNVLAIKNANQNNFYALTSESLHSLDKLAVQKSYPFSKTKRKKAGRAASCLELKRDVLIGSFDQHLYRLNNHRLEPVLSLDRPVISIAQTEFLTHVSYGAVKGSQVITLDRKDQVVEQKSFPGNILISYVKGSLLIASEGVLNECVGLEPANSIKISDERISQIKPYGNFAAVTAGKRLYLLNKQLEVINERKLPDLITALG
ncbi:MAG: hypothetical protein ABIA37_02745 [Candidatus Woesearchaeota archaeon]